MADTIDGIREADCAPPELRTAGLERSDFESATSQNLLAAGDAVSLRILAPDAPARRARYIGPMFGIHENEMAATALFDATPSAGAVVVDVLEGAAHHSGGSAAAGRGLGTQKPPGPLAGRGGPRSPPGEAGGPPTFLLQNPPFR